MALPSIKVGKNLKYKNVLPSHAISPNLSVSHNKLKYNQQKNFS